MISGTIPAGCGFSCLARSLKEPKVQGSIFYLDIMDGHFVPNISFGPGWSDSPTSIKDAFDVHLMIEKPERYLKEFAEAG